MILQRAKVSKYHQSIKIRFSTQNIKISAVSTPIFARISPFFCIFRDLPEYIGENASKCQKMQKSFAPNFGNLQEIIKNGHILIFWLYSILSYYYFGTLLDFCIFTLNILKIRSQRPKQRALELAAAPDAQMPDAQRFIRDSANCRVECESLGVASTDTQRFTPLTRLFFTGYP